MTSPQLEPQNKQCLFCGDKPCPVGYGKCHCGCGGDTARPKYRRWSRGRQFAPGDPSEFLRGHYQIWKCRQRRDVPPEGVCLYCGEDCTVGYGKCHCGCGRDAPIATESVTRKSKKYGRMPPRVLGRPIKYLMGHNVIKKINREQADEVRKYWATHPGITFHEVAEVFGVTHSTIGAILHRRRKIDQQPE